MAIMQPHWQIRPLQPSDLKRLCEIYNYYIQKTNISFETETIDVEEMRRRSEVIAQHAPYLVALVDGEVVGYAYAKPWRPLAAYRHTFESTIYLDYYRAIDRCKGIGYVLYASLIEALRQQGNVHVLFGVPTVGNEASDRLHHRLGFRREAIFEEVGYKNGRWLSVSYWSLYLK